MPSEQLQQLLREIRDLFNAAPFYQDVAADLPRFQQVCSSLDMLSDTLSAVDAFDRVRLREGEHGDLYLSIFGVLQAMQTQQDALQSIRGALAEFIGSQPPRRVPAAFAEVARIRSRAIGHPTNPGHSGTGDCFGIVQMSMKRTGFELYAFDYRKWKSESVDLTKLISNHRAELTDRTNELRDLLLRGVPRDASAEAP